MKILHFILGKADKAKPNGVNQVIAGMCKYLNSDNLNIHVFGFANSAKYEGEIIVRDGFEVEAYTKISLGSLKRLTKLVKDVDCIHLHGLYNIYNIYVALLCNHYKKPYLLTLHNGLSPVMLNQRRKILKKIFNYTFQKKFIYNASAIHVLTEEESTDLDNFGYKGKVYLIPNGIDLEEFSIKPNHNDQIKPPDSNEFNIGYLGRISKEKNLDSLIDAIHTIFEGYKINFSIAGPRSSDFELMIKNSNKSCNVNWVGPQYGRDKLKFIKSLDLFVHPSRADVFSIGAMECLACGTPLLITRTSNASYFYNKNAFYMCEPTVSGIRRGIKKALDDRNNWNIKVNAGYDLINKTFNWKVIAESIEEAYKNIITNET